MPVLITLVRKINRPRYPTVPMRLAAQETANTVWNNCVHNLNVQTIDLNGSPTVVNRIFPPERDQGEIIGGGVNDPEGTVNLLIKRLPSKDLLAM